MRILGSGGLDGLARQAGLAGLAAQVALEQSKGSLTQKRSSGPGPRRGVGER